MRILGLDPSVTSFGWLVRENSRVVSRGVFKTTNKMVFVDRFKYLRESTRDLLKECKPDKVGIESTSFGAFKSETLYSLFTHVCESIKDHGVDVVFFAPNQVKMVPRDILERPPNWKMEKMDMIEAAKLDSGDTSRWGSDEADAYWIAYLADRFWNLQQKRIHPQSLTETERKMFLDTHTFTRGKKKGITERKGILYKPNKRFFLWSENSNSSTRVTPI